MSGTNSYRNGKSQACVEKAGHWLLLISSLVLIILCLFVGYQSIRKPVIHKFYITTVADSDSLLMAQSTAKIDSLMAMIVNHEQQLSEKYQYIVEKEDNENTFLSIGTMLVGVVISIAGFFGYKSMKDIKNESLRMARQTVEDKINELDKDIMAAVEHQIDNTEEQIRGGLKEELEAEMKKYVEERSSTNSSWNYTSQNQFQRGSNDDSDGSYDDDEDDIPSPKDQFGN